MMANQISGDLGLGQEETIWGTGNVLYFDRGGGYMGTYICQNMSNCALNMGAFYFMKFISQFTERVLRKRKYSDRLEWLRGPAERASGTG